MGDDSGTAARQALQAIRTLQGKLDSLNEPVAIVGMGCRYPGAADIDAFWRLLAGGVDAVTEAPRERWDLEALYNPDPSIPGKMVSRWGGFLRKLEDFDPGFFGITPREAPHVDPRQRIMLEIAWEALEAAGIPPESLAGSGTGVYIATLTNDYDHLLFQDLHRAEAFSGSGTANSIVANRISYFLDLKGPSLAIDTACSGSLVAIHMACESLRKRETTLALAGGVNINLMPKSSVFFSKAGALSSTGRCRTFDASADGIVRSDGAGILVLKLLSQAQRDGDPIVAVIRGSAVNHDGRSNGMMAPNGEAQVAVLRAAYERAGIPPAQVQYIEAHGTGTKLGDPIEVRALADALAPGRNGHRCRLGSAKSNIGHSEAAAGVAGVIKAALALRHRLIPPSLHFHEPNPLIRFSETPFDVQTGLGEWPHPSERLVAGVSAFGFGGTNAHVVLEEAPPQSKPPETEPPFILPLSARSPEALAQLISCYGESLTEENAGALCYSAAVSKSHHPFRIAVPGSTGGELKRRLAQRSSPVVAAFRPRTAFIFSGQGSHWRGMGEGLYRREPVFRAAMDECAAMFRELAGWELLDQIGGENLNDTCVAQPAIFALQAALAALWRSWGIAPEIVVGHSLGEAAAAHTAGALSLRDAARVVFHRSRLMKRLEGKGRTAVLGVPLEEAARLIHGREGAIAVAGSNAPSTSVLSGETGAVQSLVGRLAARNVFCRMIPGVEIAFHSPQMDSLMPELERELGSIAPGPAQIPLISTVTGERIEGERLDARYWALNMRRPFLFAQVTKELLAAGYNTLLEVSPHAVLASSVAQTVRHAGGRAAIVTSLRRDEDEAQTMLESLAALYENGATVAWKSVYPKGRIVPLPNYPWQRRRYWFDQLGGGGDSGERRGVHPLLGESCEPALSAEPMRVWESDLDLRRVGYLADHKLHGEIVFPGAAFLEMAIAAARQVWPGKAVTARDVVFERPLLIDKVAPLRLQTALVVRGEEAAVFIFSRSGQSPWVRHASGKVGPEAFPSQSPVEFPARLSKEPAFSLESHYGLLASQGLEYGPAFRCIQRIWRGEGEALAEIKLAGAAHDARYGLHPASLDAAIQVVAAAAHREGAYLPVGARRWEVFRHADSFWCLAKSRVSGSGSLEADLNLFTAKGEPVAQLEGLTLASAGCSKPLDGTLIEETWEPRPLEAGATTNGRWALHGAGTELRDALIQGGQTIAEDLDTSVAGVVHMGGVESALETVQRMLHDAPQARLWLVTGGALDEAPVGGFALSAALEQPDLKPTLVRLEQGAGARELVTELLAGSDEPRVLWKGSERYVSRIRPAAAPPMEPAVLSGNATYLITGGSGALGLATASLLVDLGARHLALVSRSPKPVSIPNAEVKLIAADVSLAADVDRVFETIAAMPPLRGVIHAAGTLDDGLITSQSPQRFRSVMAPKVQGAWNLHERTAAADLDFFVLFSSAASLLGSPGQTNYSAANAYLDALARYRREMGLPALSINWGAWAAGGMADDAVRERMDARGVAAIDADEGLRMLARLLGRDAAKDAPVALGIVPVRWPEFLRRLPGFALPRFEPFGAQPSAPAQDFRARLDAAPQGERAPLLSAFLRETLAAVLGLRDGARIAAQQRFFDLGMDSLMTLEFRNRLEAELKLQLPATLAFNYPSLEALGEHLSELLPVKRPPNSADRQLEGLSESELAALLAEELAGEPNAG
jgi:acyl transferase domain-containing protein